MVQIKAKHLYLNYPSGLLLPAKSSFWISKDCLHVDSIKSHFYHGTANYKHDYSLYLLYVHFPWLRLLTRAKFSTVGSSEPNGRGELFPCHYFHSDLRWVSCRQYIYRSCSIPSATLCLLTRFYYIVIWQLCFCGFQNGG